MKITNIEYIRDYDIVLSASIDGSVRSVSKQGSFTNHP